MRDLDSHNYKIAGANQQSSHLGGGGLASSSGSGGHLGSSSLGQKTRKEPIDRFASIIDAEDPRFEKQRRENQKVWESNVQGICHSMNRSIDAFYNRKTRLYHDIVSNIVSNRDNLCPQIDINEMTEDLRDLALSPWIFQTLPGTKPSQWNNS